MTSGNHIWDKREILPFVDLIPQLLRPAELSRTAARTRLPRGQGAKRSGVPVATLNLSGRVFMNGAMDDPFTKGLAEVERLRKEAAIVIVDMHGEATSEKMAMGYYLDGRVAAVVGTHTHVPTCDHRVLPKGTAYCSDIGMTGPYDSVIGVEKDTDHPALPDRDARPLRDRQGRPAPGGRGDRRRPRDGRARAIDRMLLAEDDLKGL